MTPELSCVGFIEARLAEEEADAQALSGNRWMAGEDGEGWAIELDLGQGPDSTWGACVTCNDSGGNELTEETARHMARHDPHRAQAQAAVIRRLLALHFPRSSNPRICNEDEDLLPCEHLRAFASIWTDHPDYDPAWAA